jgi:hypothetical protein
MDGKKGAPAEASARNQRAREKLLGGQGSGTAKNRRLAAQKNGY